MKKYNLIASALIVLLMSSACKAQSNSVTEKRDAPLSQSRIESKDICAEVLQRYENGTLKDIQIGSPKENYKKSFFVDFDNDGKDEELQYFPTRTYMTLGAIVDGNRRGYFGAVSQVTAFYSGEIIVDLGGEYFVVVTAEGAPYELHRLDKMSSEDFANKVTDKRIKPPLYKTEVLCRFWKNN